MNDIFYEHCIAAPCIVVEYCFRNTLTYCDLARPRGRAEREREYERERDRPAAMIPTCEHCNTILIIYFYLVQVQHYMSLINSASLPCQGMTLGMK
jgi:hypothetical protein